MNTIWTIRLFIMFMTLFNEIVDADFLYIIEIYQTIQWIATIMNNIVDMKWIVADVVNQGKRISVFKF